MRYISIIINFIAILSGAFSAHAENTQDSLWHKTAVIYNLDVEVFKDSDNDGTGDFNGLISKLGYLDSMGITAIWLSPFQPTPNKDDGYDISDYYAVDARLGTMESFMHFMRAAEAYHIRVIMDLVVNHTSNMHPWFQAARRSKDSPYRNWYVWSDEKPKNIHTGMVFPGVQKSIWDYDSLAGAYYYHRFYEFQPDLNMQNEDVQAEVKKIISFWLQKGISGFRLDGVPFVIEVPNTKNDRFERQLNLLNDICAYIKSQRSDAIVIGEANVPPKENIQYFGERGEAMDMIFNFYVNQRIFYTLATGKTKSLQQAIEATTANNPPNAQWVEFLRNHDEVDLGRLSKRKREKVYEAMGPDSGMQLYDRGIRRRLAPMLNNERKRLELAYSLMLSLPGTPVLRYGDEIGMGDDLSLPERMSVRTPMQWSSEPNGGFSTADSCVRPVISDPSYGFQTIQVANQLHDTTSLLYWTKKMIAFRKTCIGISMARCKIIPSGSSYVLVMLYEWNGSETLVIHNFSNKQQKIKLKNTGTWQQYIGTAASIHCRNSKSYVDVPGFGYAWYKRK